MAWVRIDDRFTQNPKVAAAGPLAIAMHVAALCYCNRELTDGFVPRPIARTLLDWEIDRADGRRYRISLSCGMVGDNVDANWVIDLMVEAGLWEEVAGGYQIHDYLDYQPSKSQVVSERESNARRQAEWREKSRASNGGRNGVTNGRVTSAPNPVPKPNPVPVPDPVPLVLTRAHEAAAAAATSRPPAKPADRPATAAAAAEDVHKPTNGYADLIRPEFPKIAGAFGELHESLSATWLRGALSEAEQTANGLDVHAVLRGLERGYLSTKERFRIHDPPVTSPKALAKRIVVDALVEAASDAAVG